MSRTDAHTPVWVRQLREPHKYREEHNHTKGPCDLDVTRPNEGTCQLSWHLKGRQENLCGCSLCTGYYCHFLERRWWRQQGRQYLQDARKWSTQDRDDIDPYPRYAPPC